QDNFDAEKAGEEVDQTYVLFPVWSAGSTNPQNNDEDAALDAKEHDFDATKPESVVILSSSSKFEDCYKISRNEVNAAGSTVPTVGQNSLYNTNTFSVAGPSNTDVSPTYGKSSFIDASQLLNDPDMPELEDITYSDDKDVGGAEADFNNLESSILVSPILTTRIHKDHPKVWVLVDLPYGKRAIGTQWVYKNKKDERCIVIRNKARFVAQEHIHEERIDYEEVFAPVPRIEAIRLFLAYASFMGFMVYQMDVKSAFLYETIEEEVYVCQPSGFEDPNHPDKVYKVVKALYGLHQAPRAWYESVASCLLENGFQRGTIDQTLFIKKKKGDILLVKQKKDGIFISQDKYVAEILRKFGLTKGKSTSTPIDTEKPLLKDPDVKRIFRYLKGKPHLGLWYPKDSPFDLIAYLDSDYAGASLDIKSTTGGCQFLECRLISWQYKKQTVEVVDVVTIAKLIIEVVTAASKSVIDASTTIAAVKPQVPAARVIATPVRVVVASTRRRKGVVIRDPEEESSIIISANTKSKDKGKGIMVEEPKPLKKKQQVKMDKEPQTEAQAQKNMIMYLKNVACFRLDYFKGMSYDDIRPIFEAKFNSNIAFLLKIKEQLEEEENRAIQSINETSAQKAAKRRKLNEEVVDLKRHLEIVPDEDDDMYTEATPLARKTTLGAMFERLGGHAQVWKNQRTIHGQAKFKS
nr:hypothetical protein [Tanacetum cinerariifolium]